MEFFKILQPAVGPTLSDVVGTIREKLRPLLGCAGGQTVAIAVGSRGIDSLPTIVKTAVEEIRAAGAIPFVVPAMGSHGGGTADGQAAVLNSLGISPSAVGCEIRASGEIVDLGSPCGFPVLMSRLAWEADKIVVVNRVKPHTTFGGRIQSGLCKMLTIGLGNQEGARQYHRALDGKPDLEILTKAAEHILDKSKILCGIAVLENSGGEAAFIDVVTRKEFLEKEEKLLKTASKWMLSLPFQDIDLLWIDEIGKEISGTGMDTNVTGKKIGRPNIRYIYVDSLSSATAGNATGIGLADFCNKEILKAIDFKKTYANCLTSGFPEKAKIPVMLESGDACCEAMAKLIGNDFPRVVRIRNTMHLHEIRASAALREEADRLGLSLG